MTKDHLKEMLDKVLSWPSEAQEEAVASLTAIAEQLVTSQTPQERSAGDMRRAKEEIKALFESVRSWPQEDQEHLAELAREIQALRTGGYVTMTDEEWEEVEEGLAQADRGEFVPDEEMEAFWKKIGVL